jgi:hypothetical protein
VRRATSGFVSAAVIAIAVVCLAFAVAPNACKGGLDLYVWGGGAALLALLAIPFVTRIGQSILARIGWAIAFVILGSGTWIAGLFAANVRFICGLGYL